MELSGLCSICGKSGANNTCILCGKLVCKNCLIDNKNICRNCIFK
jgi:hypothetical protein